MFLYIESVDDLIRLLQYFHDQRIEEKLFLRWAVGYQSEMDFNEFREACYIKPTKSDEEIIDETIALFAK